MIDTLETLENKIKKFNNVSFVKLKDYRLGQFFVVTYDEVKNGIQSEKSKLRLLFKNILRCFISDSDYKFDCDISNKIILFYSHQHATRDDYVKLMQDVHSYIDSSILLTGVAKKPQLKVSLKSFFNLLLLPIWYMQISKVEKDAFMRLYLLYKLSFAYRWLNELQANYQFFKNSKGLVTIFDAREYENLMTLYFKTIGKKTATIQHGTYAAIKEFPDDYAIQFLGFVSDEMWTWGDYYSQKAIASDLGENRIVSVAYPRRVTRLESAKTGVVGVILDGGPVAETINKKLIEIAIAYASKNNMKIILKPHPHDRRDFTKSMVGFKNYSVTYDYIFDYAVKVDFSICFASSVYIDLLSVQAPVYRLSYQNIADGYKGLSTDDVFSTLEGLEKLVDMGIASNIKNRELLLGDIDNAPRNYNSVAKKLFN